MFVWRVLIPTDVDLPHDRATASHDVRAVDTFFLHGKKTPLLPADKALLTQAATNSDLYMPFKARAPSAAAMRRLFVDSGIETMVTQIGFRNVVATRYITYNSPFLLSGEQTFAKSVQDLTAAFEKMPRRQGTGNGPQEVC